jgi:sucrose-6-phosphate hydrolase SacC (GH32 family)
MYNAKRGTISVLGVTVPLMPVDNKISLEILVDRASIEIYANGGQTVISNCFTPNEDANEYTLFSSGGELGIVKLDIFTIESAWVQEVKKTGE